MDQNENQEQEAEVQSPVEATEGSTAAGQPVDESVATEAEAESSEGDDAA